MNQKEYFVLPTGEVESEQLLHSILYSRQFKWEAKEWTNLDAMRPLEGGETLQYIEELFDPEEYELLKDGWNKEQCFICMRSISDEESDSSDKSGHTNGDVWMCNSCHSMFMGEEHPFDITSKLERIRK